MPFQAPITIKTALDRMQRHEYVLPAVQREFVWSTDQTCMLFDSLMRGYPIGSFLFWKMENSQARDFVFYDFIRNYHELKSPHCPRLDLPADHRATAILDGQQRLTALNIGLRGSHAEKLPRKWHNNVDAYPEKHLYLNIVSRGAENELGMEYDFRFLKAEEAASPNGANTHWFLVSQILGLDPGPGIFKYVQQAGLAEHEHAFPILHQLHQVVHVEPTINYFEEEEQDLDKVLNIFIRVNSQGTVLSYSDLLLSIATAQWKDLDAREAIHDLVDSLNGVGQGFAFSKDLVLKAGLVLTDIGDIRFRVTNFGAANMRRLESNWDGVASALRVAARLLADFGFNERNLKADSVLIPVAFYLHRRQLGEAYLTGKAHQEDRQAVRHWVLRSLLKAGVWGSGLDTLLASLRTCIREEGAEGFPVVTIETAMARLGKSLRFDEGEIEGLVEAQYGSRNVFPLLSLLYPGLNVHNEFHEDHIFPRKLFVPARLRRAAVPEESIEAFRQSMNGLPNLQLLEGPVNTQKSDSLPMEWARTRYPERRALGMYLSSHDMHDLPEDIKDFLVFYRARRDRMAARLGELLGVERAQAVATQQTA
jgi:hypothetical protein